MTQDEIFIAQGRAYATRRELASRVSIIKGVLRRKTRELNTLHGLLERFISGCAPSSPAFTPDELVPPEELKYRLNEIDVARTAALCDELFHKADELRMLEEQIKTF